MLSLLKASGTSLGRRVHACALLDAYPVCTVNALGQTTQEAYYGVAGSTKPACPTGNGGAAWVAGGGLVAAAFFGQLQAERDANGQLTTYTYDQWGRPAGVWRPGDAGGSATQVTTYSSQLQGGQELITPPFDIGHQQRIDLGGAGTPTYQYSWTFYDGFGQAIQTQTQTQDGYNDPAVVSTGYDAFGHVLTQTMPFTGTGSGGNYQYLSALPPLKTYAYDSLGRTTSATNADGTAVRYTYSGQSTISCDEDSHRKDQILDGLGRLVQVVEYPNGTCSAPGSPATTTYSYNAADQLTGVTDAANDVTSITYNALGEKIAMTDPDLGHWSYGYDAAGNLTSQTDARGQTVCSYYDGLNRPEGKYYLSGGGSCPTAAPGYNVVYAYDHGTNGIGRVTAAGASAAGGLSQSNVCSTASGSNCTGWIYDARGRVLTEGRGFADYLSGTAFSTNHTYDDADRVISTTYPSNPDSGYAETVSTSYSGRGLPLSLTSSAQGTLVDAASYDMAGRLLGESFPAGGNLARTQGFYPWTEQGGALKSLLVAPPGGASPVLDMSYGYDAVGNLLSLTDLTAGGAPTSGAMQKAGAKSGFRTVIECNGRLAR